MTYLPCRADVPSANRARLRSAVILVLPRIEKCPRICILGWSLPYIELTLQVGNFLFQYQVALQSCFLKLWSSSYLTTARSKTLSRYRLVASSQTCDTTKDEAGILDTEPEVDGIPRSTCRVVLFVPSAW